MKLTAEQTDLLGEIVNVGIGRAASALSKLVRARVALRVPQVAVGSSSELRARWRDNGATLLSQAFDGASSGIAFLAFESRSASSLVSMITESDHDAGIESEREAVLLEVANILINGVIGVFGNTVARDVVFHPPSYSSSGTSAALPGEESEAVVVDVVFGIADGGVEGRLAVVFDLRSLDAVWPLLEIEGNTGVKS